MKKIKKSIKTFVGVLFLASLITWAFPTLKSILQRPVSPTIKVGTTIIKPLDKVALKEVDLYEVRGIDVSRHQGEIDWSKVATENIHFAYIKATEGSTYIDKNFDKNFTNAVKTNLRVGAYHFLSYDSTGVSQADNFIAKFPKMPGTLPPMIDIEFDPATVLPDQAVSDQIISDLIQKIELHYGIKPVLYVNYDSYDMFIRGKYQDYPIWICDINKPAVMPKDQHITLWQHSHTGRLQGVNKGNSNVDLNIYTGTLNDFLNKFLTK